MSSADPPLQTTELFQGWSFILKLQVYLNNAKSGVRKLMHINHIPLKNYVFTAFFIRHESKLHTFFAASSSFASRHEE